MDRLDNLEWPVLRFTEPRGIAIVCRSPEELFSARFIGIPDLARLSALHIVDSSGNKFSLASPRLKGGNPSSLKRVFLRFLNPRVSIEFGDVEALGKAGIGDVKRLLADNVRRYADFWMEYDFDSPEDLVAEIEHTKNYPTLMGLLL